MRFTTKLLPSRTGNLGILTLNHPKALHALTLDMIHCLQDVFQEWGPDPTLKAILIKSTPAKRPAFCAGGDVKAVYEQGMLKSSDNRNPADFFFQEYQVNHAIATSKIPIISLWDGVVMGGGVGISIHGKYRVATEHTLLAMPETAIGLFPDVGSMFWMPRLLSKPIANYLALTGQRLKAADLLYTGLATHYVPSQQLPALETALMEATTSNSQEEDDAVASVLRSFHEETIATDDCHLAQHQQVIDETFHETSVEGILSNLRHKSNNSSDDDDDDSLFSKKTLETLLKLSPTSLKVTLEGLQRGANNCQTIGDDLQMEYRMARACTTRPNSDFFEGVRAVLVDKDHSPKWNPATVEEVTPQMVEEFFAPIDDQEWSIPASKL